MIDNTQGITVPQVAKDLGLAPDREVMWAVGNAASIAWEREHGELPPKALRRKTTGVGSHCFAIYPPDWRERIADLFKRHHAARTRQTTLPFADSTDE